jgi:methionyl aminopeptidase
MSMSIEYKTRGELQAMRQAGLILARALESTATAVRPGITTAELDAVAAQVISDAGATSNFLGYHGFPATLCISVNDEVVHGIPGGRVLEQGDLVSIDGGCIKEGWHADAALSLHVGEPPHDEDQALAEVDLINAAWRSLWAGVAAAAGATRLGDISAAIEASILESARADGRRYGNVDGYGGHGIGTEMHMDPFLANVGKKGKGAKVAAGMALGIEPMLTLGKSSTRVLADEWTVVTKDGTRAAHVEHSIAICEDGISVLTAPDRGRAELAPFGITPVDLDS